MKTALCTTAPWTITRHHKQRAPWWDYSQNGTYGVTFCTHNDRPLFGQWQGGELKLSAIGQAALWFWRTLPEHTFMNVTLHGIELTPQHLHAIITLERPADYDIPEQPIRYTEDGQVHFSSFAPKLGSLSQMVRSFKGAVTRSAHQMGWLPEAERVWQGRYYDHIMMSEEERAYYEELLLESQQGATWSSASLQGLEAPQWLPAWEALRAARAAARLAAEAAIGQTEYNAAH